MSCLTASIALCTYNGERFLKEQLESLLVQTRLPDELVVFDDCSTDSTAEILSVFAQAAPFPVHVSQNTENYGYNQNFGLCAQRCIGDVIFFCDQDDVWHPDKIEKFMAVFEAQPDTGIVISESRTFTETDGIERQYGSLSGESVARIMRYPSNYMDLFNTGRFDLLANKRIGWNGHAMAYRSRYTPYVFPIPDGEAFDVWCLIVLCAATDCRLISEPMVDYRIHDNSVTQSRNFQTKKDRSSKEFPLTSREIVQKGYCDMAQLALEDAQNLEKLSLGSTRAKLIIKAFRNRSAHYFRRAAMRDNLWKRYLLAIRELVNGRYFRHSSGLLSFFMDCIKINA